MDRIEARLELAKSLGASYTINTSDPHSTTLIEAVKAVLSNGVSIVIETTGVPALIEEGLQSTHARGRLLLIGVPPLGYNLSVIVTDQINVSYLVLLKLQALLIFGKEWSCNSRMH